MDVTEPHSDILPRRLSSSRLAGRNSSQIYSVVLTPSSSSDENLPTSRSNQLRPSSPPLARTEISAPNNTTQQSVLFDERNKFASVNKYLDLTIGITILAHFLETTLHAALNAAITIFGLGVGVGLILGDSCRAAVPGSNHNHNLPGVSSSAPSPSSPYNPASSQVFNPSSTYTYTLSSDLPAQ
jgi:hypothetical protein